MPLTSKGTPYVVSTDLVANYPTVSSDLADHIDDNLQYNAQDINAQTGSGANAYTFALADASLYKLVTATNAATATYTVPPQSAVTWANGAVLRILNQGAGVLTLAGGSGVTLNGAILTLTQYQYAEIHRTASNTWTVIGIATPPGLVKITDSTFTTQSSVSINNCFSTTYDAYRIVIRTTGSVNADLGYRNRLSGTDATTNYNRQFLSGSGATPASGRVTGQVNAVLGSHRTTGQSEYWVDIYGPALAAETGIYSLNRDRDGDISLINYVALHTTATAYDGFTIFPGSGTMTGTLRVYGYRN